MSSMNELNELVIGAREDFRKEVEAFTTLVKRRSISLEKAIGEISSHEAIVSLKKIIDDAFSDVFRD